MSGKTTLIRFAAALVVGATIAGGTAPASAAIDTVVNNDRPFTINTDIPLATGRNPDDTTLRLWDEEQDFVLASALRVNRLATGGDGKLLAGTVISSHMLQWDGIKGSGETDVFAEIVFESDILGIISGRKNLRNSDYLGLDSVNYKDFENRGTENSDKYQILGDGMTLRIEFNAPDPGDWIRIITAQNPVVIPDPEDDPDDTPEVPDDDGPPDVTEVPAPAALPAGLAMMVAMATRRRRAANRR